MARVAWAVIGIACATPVAGQVYTGHDAAGSVVLSNFQSADAPTLIIATREPAPSAILPAAESQVATAAARPAPMPPSAAPRLPPHYLTLIRDTARAHRIPPALVAAIAAAESGFDPRAVSPKGAVGLMQLMPATARRFNVRDRFSAQESLRGGAAYLRWLTERFDRDLPKVLAAYNAGEQAVIRAGGMPGYPETMAYVPRVLRYMQDYDALLRQ